MAFTGSDWGRRVKLTGLSPSATLSGFVAVVTLDNVPVEAIDAGSNSALNGGGDLRFSTDDAGATQLELEVVSYVTNATEGNRQCQLWIRFPTYASGTREAYMFYKKTGETQPAVTAAFGRNAVWASFKAVYHLKDTTDSTGNGHTLTLTGTSFVAGMLGNALSLNGTTDRADTAISSVSYPFVLSAWVNKDTSTSTECVASVADKSSTSDQFRMQVLSSDEFQNSSFDGSQEVADTTSTKSVGVWGRITNRFTASNDRSVYMDGANKVSNTVSQSHTLANQDRLTLGTTGDSTPTAFYEGLIDELWLRDGDTTDDMELSEYDNQSVPATFWTTGTPDTPGTQDLTPTGITSAEAFGTPVVTTGSVDISPSGIASTEAFGTAVLSQATFITPNGIASEEAFGTAALTPGAVIVTPSGIASAEAFGTAVITQGFVITPTGIASAEAFGTAAITTGAVNLSPTGIASEEAFGSHTVAVAGAKEIKIDFQDELVLASNLQSTTLYFNGSNYFTID